MRSVSVWGFPKRSANFIRHTLICVLGLSVAVLCADREPEHIVSQHTEQTIKFFSRSRSESYPNVLNTIHIAGSTCLAKNQTATPYKIALNQYTLASVPEHLVGGLVFNALLIEPSIGSSRFVPFDRAVLCKILQAFGTINANIFQVTGLNFGEPAPGITQHSRQPTRSARTLGRPQAPTQTPPEDATPSPAQAQTRCHLKINSLRLVFTTQAAIKWVLDQIEIESPQIEVEIRGQIELDSLEVLDVLHPISIRMLRLCGFTRFGSLDCKLLREGPMPEELIIDTPTPLSLKIPDQVIYSMVDSYWKALTLPMEAWAVLMKPAEHPKTLAVSSLKLYIPIHSSLGEFQLALSPPMGDAQVAANSLNITFWNSSDLVTPAALVQTLDWTSRHFIDMLSLVVGFKHTLTDLTAFVRKNQFLITTSPLTKLRIAGIDCLFQQNPDANSVLHMSLDAWDRCTEGTLSHELTKTRSDISVLSSGEQEMITNQKWIGEESDSSCAVCLATVDELKNTSPPVDICILDHPEHRVCSGCLDKMVSEGDATGRIGCPMCRGVLKTPLQKQSIHKNDQDGFVLTSDTTSDKSDILSFPSDNLERLLN
ncbi:hypothetical protein NEDG_01249 [Nematocida displodere]|uniref:RING-type domain-containing protein n=1 Tax=Nematocida displodere TaxID=1805483 RepID=A0A177ECJ4_9MICR|nr:hypothetical protein NEDG_01249 [Nematocida displodere]